MPDQAVVVMSPTFLHAMLESYERTLVSRFNYLVQQKQVESPIEAMFDVLFFEQTKAYPLGVFECHRQVKIEEFRVDFLIKFWTSGSLFAAVVECDGRDFHHATWQQIERDRQRDQVLEKLAMKVFRFPGTQIHNDPLGCMEAIWEWVEKCQWTGDQIALAKKAVTHE